MRRVALILSTALALSFAAGQAGAATASAEKCRDTHGHYVACPKPTATPAEAHPATKTAQPRCRNEKGAFVKCPPGGSATATAAAPAAAPAETTKPAKSSKAAKSASAAPTGTTASTAATTSAAPGAVTAKCKDGTVSHSQHRSGTCASHGGVAQWM